MANIITASRIVLSVIMYFIPATSLIFYILYCLGGISDVADGIVARVKKTASRFGAVFDSVADLIFVFVSLFKIAPNLNIPAYLWLWTGVILLIKLINMATSLIVNRKLLAEHTIINKITGTLLFIVPLITPLININISGIIVCIIATLAALYEGILIRKNSDNTEKENKDTKNDAE